MRARALVVPIVVPLAVLIAAGSATPMTHANASGQAAATGDHTVLTGDHTVLPAKIGAGPDVGQMITISARSFSSTTAWLKAWSRTDDGTWQLDRGPVRVLVGYGGWVVAADRVQSTGTTPAGRFRLPFAFGRWDDPGTALRYRHVDDNDWWPYEPRDPATYNVYQAHRSRTAHWRPGYAEHLDDYTRQYRYAIVVGFNLPHGIHYSHQRHQWIASDQADKHRGGGIFLHVSDGNLTEGCVAMPTSQVRWLLTWIDPQEKPEVVMGPHDYIVTL